MIEGVEGLGEQARVGGRAVGRQEEDARRAGVERLGLCRRQAVGERRPVLWADNDRATPVEIGEERLEQARGPGQRDHDLGPAGQGVGHRVTQQRTGDVGGLLVVQRGHHAGLDLPRLR